MLPRRRTGRPVWQFGVSIVLLIVMVSLWRTTVDITLPLDDDDAPLQTEPAAVDEPPNEMSTKPPKWIILLEVNNGYLDFFQNWWIHYEKLQLTVPVVVIAQDDTAYQTLSETLAKQSTLLTIERSLTLTTPDKSVDYDSPSYHNLVSGRATHILQKLQTGQNIVYTDTDTVWVKDPMPYLIWSSNTQQPDMILQVDNQKYFGVSPYYCTGLMSILSNDHTIRFFQDWQTQLQRKPQLNQPIFNELLHQKSRRISHQPLSRTEFPGGNLYFTGTSHEGKTYSPDQRKQAVVVHNNYIQGHDPKKKRFQDAGLWKLGAG